MKETDKQILNIALPAIVSNITVPLLGLVDVTIVGHLGNAAYIGAIAVGGMLFNIIYWVFAFLRMGTSGMTAQLYGKHLADEIVQMAVRSVGIGMMAALALIILQIPIREAAFFFIHPTEEIKRLATTYFHICIWGAPATLGLYGLTGWYIGMQNSRIPMIIAITQNVVNIIASLCLVYIGGLKVEGVALGTLIAQYAGFLMGIGLWIRHYGGLWKHFSRKGLWKRQAMWHFFQINRDIFLRTLCLVSTSCQHLTNAIIYTLFLYNGRICIRRRSTYRQTHRSSKLPSIHLYTETLVRMGRHHGFIVHHRLRHRRQYIPSLVN